MSVHDDLITALLEVLEPRNGELRLLARLNDPLVGNRSTGEVFLFVPDLHLVSRARRARFGRYGFNHEQSGLLAAVLEKLALLKKRWERRRCKLVTVQLGDFFDLWREFPRAARPEEIADDEHGAIRDLLYRNRDRGGPCLKATMLLGNHDTKRGVPLAEIDWRLKSFNRSRDGRPFLFTTHGDAFDVIENEVPDPIKEFVVNFIGKLTPTNKYDVGTWGRLAAKHNKPFSELEHAITEPEHGLTLPAGAPLVKPGKRLPARLVKEVRSLARVRDGKFQPYYQALAQGTETCSKVRVMAVGHSHEAGLILCQPGGGQRPLVVLDAGGWIENCRYPLEEGGRVTEPSAQLGVIAGNDLRIYQLRVS